MARIEDRVNYFWDTSALAKRYAKERGHRSVDTLIDEGDTVCHVPCVVRVELYSVLSRKLKENAITAVEFANARSNILADLADSRLFSLDLFNLDLGLAESLAQKYAIQGIDAIILAFGLQMWRDRFDEVFFVTCDRDLADAARAEGFSTYNPLGYPRHPLPKTAPAAPQA